MSSNINNQIQQLGSQLMGLRINNRVERHETNDPAGGMISISDSSGSYTTVEVPKILVNGADSITQSEGAFVEVSHPDDYVENGRPVPFPSASLFSPMNSMKPHPCCSISTAILQEAIMDSLKPGSWYERSILRHESIYKDEIDLSSQRVIRRNYDSWRWIPYVFNGARHQYSSDRVYPGDVEVISIRDDVTRFKTERQERVFEYPANVGQFSPIVSNICLDLSEPEKAGWRVLVWRVHGDDESPYMDRQGRVVADPRVHLSQ
ncbi:hypothetical protein FLAG1_10007 [Fusarium langsethiae]|uniref:Uncharacterized protein n=1 Tax=Fusarium langsethiae TaxID=179993 RepID=A0A0M9EPX0_FUSLA|nr:hypothetical protein FLAG1_10007 [Fusarium langsethiae]GKU07241.1 unnamed protein product [Fusarium langsethiae]